MITSFHLKWRTRKLSRCVKCDLSAHVNLQIMKFGSAEAENSLSLDRATDDCQPVPSLSPPLRVNEWATKILPSSVLRISSATYLTVKSLYLSERIPQRYKFTLPRNQHLFDSFSPRGRLKTTRPSPQPPSNQRGGGTEGGRLESPEKFAVDAEI